jgi:hypothetical protein
MNEHYLTRNIPGKVKPMHQGLSCEKLMKTPPCTKYTGVAMIVNVYLTPSHLTSGIFCPQ